MKKADLEKLKGKKIPGTATSRGSGGTAVDRREQALARKRELLGQRTKAK
jgi:hypothetical protein